MDCHGTESEPHGPTRLEYVETNPTGHANLRCPTCGVTLETDENTARRVAPEEGP